MGQILIRNIDDDVHQRLKAKAAKKGQSLEAYVRGLLGDDVKRDHAELLARAAAFRAKVQRTPLSEEEHQAIIAAGKKQLDERGQRLVHQALGNGEPSR